MSFVDICWLIVKICGCVIVLFLALGFTAKQVKKNRDKKIDQGDYND